MSAKKQFSASASKALRDALDGDLDSLIDAGQLLKNDKTTTVVKLDIAEISVVIKRYNARSFWHRIKRAMRQSRAMRCWIMSEKFSSAGLQVAQRIAVIENHFGPFYLDAYFIAEWVNAEELLTWLPKQSQSKKANVQQQIKHTFSLFKVHRFSHGDMKATNLLWHNQKITFLDLDAAKQHWLKPLWIRSFRRDKKRFAKNGSSFADLLSEVF